MAEPEATINTVQLVSMEQLAEAVDVKDNWTGVTSSKERRKRQNRLNQRAYRKRKTKASSQDDRLPPSGRRKTTETLLRQSDIPNSQVMQPHQRRSLEIQTVAFASFQRADTVVQRRNSYFPLTRDHDLLPLVAVNVCRAVLTNYNIILTASARFTNSFTDCAGEVGTLLSTLGTIDFVPLPETLEPTALQLAIPHECWVDMFPSSRFRDNIISAIANEDIDGDEFIENIVGSLFEWMGCSFEPKDEVESQAATIDPMLLLSSSSDYRSPPSSCKKSEELGIIAWGNPWDVAGWEMTPKFASRWSFLLKDCQEMIDASNTWRLARGEESLVVEM